MTSTECRMANMPWISSYLVVTDVDQSLEFYKNAFGFSVAEEVVKNEEGVSAHAEMRYYDCVIMLGLENFWEKNIHTPNHSKTTSPISLYVYCPDVDQLFEQALSNQAEIVSEPEDTFWGDRTCRLKDLNGYIWSFATHVGIKQ